MMHPRERSGLINGLFEPLIQGNLAPLGGLSPSPAGRVPLLHEVHDGLLEVSELLFNGLMVLLNSPFGLLQLQLSNLEAIDQGGPFIREHLPRRTVSNPPILGPSSQGRYPDRLLLQGKDNMS